MWIKTVCTRVSRPLLFRVLFSPLDGNKTRVGSRLRPRINIPTFLFDFGYVLILVSIIFQDGNARNNLAMDELKAGASRASSTFLLSEVRDRCQPIGSNITTSRFMSKQSFLLSTGRLAWRVM